MKYTDFPTLFDSEPADFALLSTFNFEPDYFERQLLRSRVLARAYRIVIFMDSGQWLNLRSQDVPARLLNRRYLVVPVHYKTGVFHPKLHLLLSGDSAQVLCGSNNLTRAGCSHNLEIVNSIDCTFAEDGSGEYADLGKTAFRFFEQAAKHAQGQAGKLATLWINQHKRAHRWLDSGATTAESNSPVRLLHTFDGGLWVYLKKATADFPPRRILAISPFYDVDAEMLVRFRKEWPKCRIELVAQQHTSNLPVEAIQSARLRVQLSEVSCRPRRLHAKLFAWESEVGTQCVVGSANLTSAAWDGRNVEACFLIPEAGTMLESLFDSHLASKSVKIGDFVAGNEREPEQVEDGKSTLLNLRSALLVGPHDIRVHYGCSPELAAEEIALSVRAAGERDPRAAISIPLISDGEHTVHLRPEVLSDVHSAVCVSLVAQVPDGEKESACVWLIQEDRLTYVPSDDDSTDRRSTNAKNGFFIPEYLEELGRRGGVAALVEYLNGLDIHFHGGEGEGVIGGFGVRPRDPFHPDVLPEWWHTGMAGHGDLLEAILQFVRRHEDRKLQRHAKLGNLNGMDNFLDIFVAIVRLLYVYRQRHVVGKGDLIRHIGRCVEIATTGMSSDRSPGYLRTLASHLSGNKRRLREVAANLNFAGYLRAGLLIAQADESPGKKAEKLSPGDIYRVVPSEIPGRFTTLVERGGKWVPVAQESTKDGLPVRQRLPQLSHACNQGFSLAGVPSPTSEEVMAALEGFSMMPESELEKFRSKLSR